MATTKIGTPQLFDFSSLNTALQLPTGDTASRPSSPSTGEWRYNNELKYVEYWDGGAWRQIDTEQLPLPDDFPSQNFNVNTYSGSGAAQTIDAKFNEAANFGVSGSVINLSPGLDTFISSNAIISVSLWVKINTQPDSSGQVIFSLGDSRGIVAPGQQSFSPFRFGAQYANSNGSQKMADAAFTLNTWTHVVGVLSTNSSDVKLYVDKVLQTTGGATDYLGLEDDACIGNRDNTGYTTPFKGAIDQVRIYPGTLTQTQINDLYAETTTTASTLNYPSGAGCIAAYQLDGDASDVSGNYNGAVLNVGFTGLQFQPDFVWIKKTNSAQDHALFDSVRGVDKILIPNSTQAQYDGGGSGYQTSFDSNGFSLTGNTYVNGSSNSYVAWCLKAGGSSQDFNVDGTGYTTASAAGLTAGDITPTGSSVNTASGFSIIKYPGNSAASATIPHGLSSAPELVIVKAMNLGAGWPTQAPGYFGFRLNSGLQNDTGNGGVFFANTAPTSTVVTVGSTDEVNDGYNYIMYNFHSVDSYQRVGTYTGNNSTDGDFVYTTSDGTATGTGGFEPAFLMIKSTGSGGWHMYDNKRNTQNPRDNTLEANGNFAESISTSRNFDFYSNGFQPKTTNTEFNAAGVTYIYLAIAANPAPTPTLANSFKAVAYTGDGVNGRSVNDVGFLPQFTWIKNLDAGESHVLIDQLRYPTNIINSNEAISQYDNTSSSYQSFIGNGFTIGNDGQVNSSSVDYISYNWKGASIPTINNAGTITSVTSVNDAAGFSAVAYKGTGANATVGHGLQTAPQLILFKAAGAPVNWVTYNVHSTATKYMSLNLAFGDYSSATEFQDTDPTGGASGVITLGSSGNPNNATYPMVAYCFHDISGYQKIGTYTATGTGDFDVNIGFTPSFLLIKKTSADSSFWSISDSARSTGTLPYFVYKNLYANTNSQQGVASPPSTNAYVQYRTNGFGWTSAMIAAGTNPNYWESGQTYIYLAIK